MIQAADRESNLRRTAAGGLARSAEVHLIVFLMSLAQSQVPISFGGGADGVMQVLYQGHEMSPCLCDSDPHLPNALHFLNIFFWQVHGAITGHMCIAVEKSLQVSDLCAWGPHAHCILCVGEVMQFACM